MTEKRDDLYLPSREFVEQAHIQSRAEYERMWKQSIEDPDTFWGYIAKDFHWFKPWTQVYRGEPEIGDNEWFVGGKTNICYNCLDAQIEKGRGDKVALLFQGEPEADCKRFTYNDLLKHVCRFANALKKNGVKKGDRIVLYLPMIWQLPVVMLACARIGAVHTVVFGGFSAEALADRMLACGAKKMVTTNGYWRSGQKINAKANADKACMLCANAGLTIDDVFVVDRMVDFEVPYITYRDTALSKELMLDEISDYCPAEKMDAEDPLFIMYTSGSTGSPKGTLHTTAGYMVYTYTTFKYIFDYKEDDIFFCTADIGWITGRIDDVVNISGHRLGTVEIEDALLSHPAIVEAAVVGYPHKVKGEDLYAFVILDKNSKESEEDIRKELKAVVRSDIGPIAVPGKIQFVREMPKNRSGKVVRRILRKIASNEIDEISDSMINILAEPGVVDEIAQNRIGDK